MIGLNFESYMKLKYDQIACLKSVWNDFVVCDYFRASIIWVTFSPSKYKRAVYKDSVQVNQAAKWLKIWASPEGGPLIELPIKQKFFVKLVWKKSFPSIYFPQKYLHKIWNIFESRNISYFIQFNAEIYFKIIQDCSYQGEALNFLTAF